VHIAIVHELFARSETGEPLRKLILGNPHFVRKRGYGMKILVVQPPRHPRRESALALGLYPFGTSRDRTASAILDRRSVKSVPCRVHKVTRSASLRAISR
jgi:hypothetical protein